METSPLALISQAVSEKKMFEKNGNVHVYSPGTGADNPLGSISFHLQYYSVNIVLCCKLSSIKRLCNSFPPFKRTGDPI